MIEEHNPFWVWSPDDIPAAKATELFVDTFTDFPEVESPGHTFLNGPRGSGKSMMFRMMRADCARLRRSNSALKDLPYIGLYVPIKKTEITQTEMVYLDQQPARYVFSEHLLCLYVAQKVCDELSSPRFDYDGLSWQGSAEWMRRHVTPRLGTVELAGASQTTSIPEVFASINTVLKLHWDKAESIIRRIPLQPDVFQTFDDTPLSYHGFLLPLVEAVGRLPWFGGRPIYLLMDDVDNLSLTQTQILNTWIAARSTTTVCIKASTQLRYKTRLTFGGLRIEAPHDYNEVDVSVLYTTRRENYQQRLELIASRRLKAKGLTEDPRAFFREDSDQAAEIQRIESELRARFDRGDGRGARQRDDVNRYARPEYIRRLGGERKASSKYSYSGFDQLAHVSSGVIRWFLEPASRMYTAQQTSSGGAVALIEPHIQNQVVREFAEEFFVDDLRELKKDAKTDAGGGPPLREREQDYERLELLIEAMGRTFHDILVDENRAERRVFSIALSDRPDETVQRVLDLGVAEGYLYRATIGTKSGLGRTARYVLSRRLAPYFTLDPTSFSGYLFVTSSNLRNAMHTANALLRAHGEVDVIQIEMPL